MKKFLIKVNGKDYEVEVEEVGGTQPVAAVKAAPQPVISSPKKEEPKISGKVGSVTINAPMPGTILKINKNAGDSVKKGEAIMILEAMKMENEIVAPADGVVSSVNVNTGASVEAGQLLASIA